MGETFLLSDTKSSRFLHKLLGKYDLIYSSMSVD